MMAVAGEGARATYTWLGGWDSTNAEIMGLDFLYGRSRRQSHGAVSTVSFKPTALVTATRVESRGFPRTDKARYRLSRSMPAALATLAMPPRASATRRRAISRTLGSSVSSNAARRYSAANSGFLRSSRIVASSWDTLALRFMVSFRGNL